MSRRQVSVVETLSNVAGHLSFGPPKTSAALRTVEHADVRDGGALPTARLPPGARPGVHLTEGRPVQPTLFRSRFWNSAVDRAGLAPLRIHDLRHTAVALWIAAGSESEADRRTAGHTSVSVVLDRYGHLMPDHDAEFMRRLEDLHWPGSRCLAKPGR